MLGRKNKKIIDLIDKERTRGGENLGLEVI
jgi:hypothetical protein